MMFLALFACWVAQPGQPVSPSPRSTVSTRQFELDHKTQIAVGAVFLQRFDVFASPGVSLSFTHHFTRALALDVEAAYFFTTLVGQGRAIFEETGHLPDREVPRLWVGAGARYAFAYGKFLLESPSGSGGSVVHVIPSMNLLFGALMNDQRLGVPFGAPSAVAFRPALQVGPQLRVQLNRTFDVMVALAAQVSLENGELGNGEPRRVVFGLVPKVALGVSF